MPKISVVMPVYNGERYLKEAVDSILNQTLSDFEFIIIDDGSTDSTEDIIKSYSDSRIKYIKNEKNLGVALTLNKGLDAATGEYIARMDADDISLSDRFHKQTAFMEEHKNIAVCSGIMEYFGEIKTPKCYTVFGIENMRINMLFDSCLYHPAVMMRRSVIEAEHYRYDNAFDKVEDYELWTRVMLKYDIDNVNSVLLRYRIHKNQVTQNYTEEHNIRASKVRHNLLRSLGVDGTDKELIAYSDFCLHKIDYDKQLPDLISIFNKIVDTNKKTGFFSDKLLQRYLMQLVIKSYKQQNAMSEKCLIAECDFLTKSDLIKDKLRQTARDLIKRDKA